MIKKRLIIIAIVALVTASGCVILMPHEQTANTFGALVGIQSKAEKPLSLGNAPLEGFYAFIEGGWQKAVRGTQNTKGKLLVEFSDRLDVDIASVWSMSGYDVLTFTQIGAGTEYFVGGLEDYIDTHCYEEVRFLGGNMGAVATEYMCDKYSLYSGNIPSRLTVIIDSVHCDTDKMIDFEDLERAIETVNRFGIATEIITAKDEGFSSEHATYLCLNDGETDCEKWYTETLLLENNILDSRMYNTHEVAPTAITTNEYVLARAGIRYAKDGENITSQNIDSAVCFGIVSENYSPELCKRVANVRVELYLISGTENRLMGCQITDIAGFYSFDVPGIYANGFDEFYVVAYPPASCLLCQDYREITFIFPHMKSSKNINIGVVKNEESK